MAQDKNTADNLDKPERVSIPVNAIVIRFPLKHFFGVLVGWCIGQYILDLPFDKNFIGELVVLLGGYFFGYLFTKQEADV